MLDYSDARDHIFGIANTVWITASAPIVGYVPDVRWPGVIEPKPDNSKYWARVSLSVVDRSQSAVNQNFEGKRKYTTTALFFLQLFCPKGQGDTLPKGIKLAEAVKSAFCKQDDDIWFRNQKVVELPPESDNYPVNVVITCIFDTLE